MREVQLVRGARLRMTQRAWRKLGGEILQVSSHSLGWYPRDEDRLFYLITEPEHGKMREYYLVYMSNGDYALIECVHPPSGASTIDVVGMYAVPYVVEERAHKVLRAVVNQGVTGNGA